ncbi:hypothetical protein BHE74_00004891, partial [Ensete ventricosum]
ISRDDANHRPAHSPINADVGISIAGRSSASTTARSAPTATSSEGATRQQGTAPPPDRGYVEKSERLGDTTGKPFPGHYVCALRTKHHILGFRLGKGTTALD